MVVAPSFRILNMSLTIGGHLGGDTTESQSFSITAVGSVWGSKHRGASVTKYHPLNRICYQETSTSLLFLTQAIQSSILEYILG